MSLLKLDTLAFIRLQAQLQLNGTFAHTLRHERAAARVSVSIEQCDSAIWAQVVAGPRTSSITLERENPRNALRLASLIEATVNGTETGTMPAHDDPVLEMEILLRSAIRAGRGHYRLPIEDLDVSLSLCEGRFALQATLASASATLLVLLPRDSQQAFRVLRGNVRQFIASHRSALAA